MTAHDGDSTWSPAVDVVTPSYLPDLELCKDLNRSLLRHTPPSFRHQILVSRRDMVRFRGLEGTRTTVENARDLLPASFLRLPLVNGWVSVRKPWPPVRGWIAQQIVKIAAAARSNADAVLLVDSDMVFVRPVVASVYLVASGPTMYRADDAVHDGMPRHVLWHRTARELLGLDPAAASPPLPDYICWPCAWSPELVRRMLRRIEEVTGKPWQLALGCCLHLSEMILYGVYVDEVLDPAARPHVVGDMKCANHSAEIPLGKAELEDLVAGLRPDDVAVMVSSKSGTDLKVRREVLGHLAG